MNDLRKAAEMALAKLEHLWDIGIDAEYRVELLPEIEALRQAIEQAEYEKMTVKFDERAKEYLEEKKKSWEQEPWDTSDMAHRPNGLTIDDDDIQEYKRLWVGLTVEEIMEADTKTMNKYAHYMKFARALEAKLKEKNT